MTTPELSILALAVPMAVAAGLVGCFAVMRRMTLAADALSHVALPGIGLALLLRLQPILGAIAMLLFGALLVWGLERRTGLPTDAVIGVVFSAALAIGSLVTSGEALLDALFGGGKPPTGWEAALGIAVALSIIAFLFWARDRLVVTLVSPDIARTLGIPVARIELLFLVAFSLTVALGLRFLGVLLMGSLIIIPAATAKRVTRSLRGMFGVSVALAVTSTLAGFFLAEALHRERGPLVILIAAALFFFSLLYRG
ncbi:MAG: metal ABC transporter permease [Deltaproteobacteria bacterium]